MIIEAPEQEECIEMQLRYGEGTPFLSFQDDLVDGRSFFINDDLPYTPWFPVEKTKMHDTIMDKSSYKV
jgi:hypothetical protein